jgi:DNA-binding HxlR family transcriptional regulator
MSIRTAQANSRRQALAAALDRVGDRWSLLVVDALLAGARRFGELQADLDGIATNVLSKRLKQLEATGVIVARPYSARPPRFAYELTAAGQELGGALRLLSQWGADRAGADPGADVGGGPAHGTCGTTLEARWYCPTCDRIVDADTDELRFL